MSKTHSKFQAKKKTKNKKTVFRGRETIISSTMKGHSKEKAAFPI